MDTDKRKRLEAAGWTVGSVQDLLELSPEEAEAVERRARADLDQPEAQSEAEEKL